MKFIFILTLNKKSITLFSNTHWILKAFKTKFTNHMQHCNESINSPSSQSINMRLQANQSVGANWSHMFKLHGKKAGPNIQSHIYRLHKKRLGPISRLRIREYPRTTSKGRDESCTPKRSKECLWRIWPCSRTIVTSEHLFEVARRLISLLG